MVMHRRSTSLAILFADISQSTKIYKTLGNQAGQKLIADCLKLMADVTSQHEGTVVKTIGDEIMCTFPSASHATEAAKGMQESLEQTPVLDKPGIGTVNIRIGIHSGPVIRSSGDVFGDAVIVAARMVALAKARQILTTEQTVEMLAPEARALTRRIDTTRLKGKPEELSIYEVIWAPEDLTIMSKSALVAPIPQFSLKVRCGDTSIELDQTRPIASLGRHPTNDIVVDEVFVSRWHCRIEYRRGRFVLIDQSTNGTYVLTEGHEIKHVRRDEITLYGHGIIGLGRSMEPDSSVAIHFSYES